MVNRSGPLVPGSGWIPNSSARTAACADCAAPDSPATERGLRLRIANRGADGVLRKADDVETSVYARMLAEDVV
ncbi:hypothetical protein ACN6LA_007607, partial [Streptomyces sp. SAS_269]|uniref:hypothetical protein n=1 Tax=Streptomyces sp. SAS_269 TaxID=3412749 RepID=UPI00403CADB9